MRHLLVRAAGGAMLVSALSFGAMHAFAAGATGAEADTADTLPAGAISASTAQLDALKAYPGATATAAGVDDQDGTIVYSFTVSQQGKAYDVKVNALTGAVIGADAAGADSGEAAGSGAEAAGGNAAAAGETGGSGGPTDAQGADQAGAAGQ